MKTLNFALLTVLLSISLPALASEEMDPLAKPIGYDKNLFRGEPTYERLYRPDEQIQIYGGKHQNSEPYYPLLFGRRMYGYGPLGEGFNIFGSRNLAFPRLMAFGDWRNVYNYSRDDKKEVSELNTRLNLDMDLQITATERVHAFTRPLDDGGDFTGCNFGPDPDKFGDKKCKLRTDFKLDALFFEGDMGSIGGGIFNHAPSFDLPFAVGEMPFVLHDGVWVNDIFLGAAFSIPAKNSAWLNISNFDVTVFGAIKDVNSVVQDATKNDEARIYGINFFGDMWNGYLEQGYGYTEDRSLNQSSFHSTATTFKHRWNDIGAFAERVITDFGQSPGKLNNKITAQGAYVELDSSWETKHPYTYIPYVNLFAGFNKPQGLAKQDAIATNVGILFEGDGVTSFPFLDGSANDTYGGAAGLEYLFNMDKQIVFELATVQIIGSKFDVRRKEKAPEYGSAVRLQLPLTKALIWRSDAMFDYKQDQRNIYGLRTELRVKF